MPVLSGKAHWASIANPNTTFEPVYSIDLAIEGDELNKARQLGLTIKNKGVAFCDMFIYRWPIRNYRSGININF